ncbi:MAG TPA: OB-fold domain-containing protein [Acidimicrobiales bacterium]|nr:OB-fold domain-containing protein [Acidimicrobiales bacterium]
MRGLISAAGYLPYRRLARQDVAALLGSGGGRGTRAVAGYDEDTTTMAVEAARLARRSAAAAAVDAVWLATASPAYLDKTNATALHAALRLPAEAAAFDFGGALRSGMGAMVAATLATGTIVVAMSDQRDGLPGGADESFGGDAAAAVVVGDDAPGAPVIAEVLGRASATDEFLDRWRSPGERRSKVWEERFAETRYLPLGRDAWERALKDGGVEAHQLTQVAVTAMHGRAAKALGAKLGLGQGVLVDDLSGTVGQCGAAHPGLLLAGMLERARPGDLMALVHLADGADVVVLRATEAIATWAPARPLAAQVECGAPLTYGRFLSWRGMLTPEPPRRPEPQRVSGPAAWRSEDWKFGFVGSRDRSSGAVHLPPSRVSMQGGALDDMEQVPMADAVGTVVTFTVDHLAYSPSPPVVFAVIDFDGGGRFPLELTDVDVEQLAIGDRVEMTFRRLFSADGIHDYFWKARPQHSAAAG